MSMKRSAQVTLAVLVGLGALLPLADAQTGFRMPRALVWTAYDVGSAGYSQAASIGHVMQQKEGVTLRVIPAGNDVARQIPLVRRTAQFGALGNAFFLSQEGVMDFAAPEWGPQQVRIIAAAWADFNTGVASCAADAYLPVKSTLRYFKDEYIVHIRDKICPTATCVALHRYEVVSEKCTKCQACVRNCPVKAISGSTKEVAFINKEKCIKCNLCYEKCNFMAIK